jgi:ubiquinol-cytochrome c reductase cytochrome b subunit
MHPEEPYLTIGQIATIFYFLYFIIIIPIIGLIENTLFDIANDNK